MPIVTKPKKKRAKAELFTTNIVEDWEGGDSPWNTRDLEHLGRGVSRLHEEVLDLYKYCRPRKFEDDMRNALVDRMSQLIASKYPDSQVKCFGSFAAGLHLPDADMDLVALSPAFQSKGRRDFANAFTLKAIADLFEKSYAVTNSVERILSAKVPIVKFVDKHTGLKVDVSFDNSTGIPAIAKCLAWKQEYPAMPIVLCAVKLFLKMRGSDEVFTGGIGGFSTTCMVVSLLQHISKYKHPGFVPHMNLGETLLLFFEYYGKIFNPWSFGIQMHPPQYFRKRDRPSMNYRPNRPESLSIIDPNKPGNDLSKGSTNSQKVLKAFSDAHTALAQQMETHEALHDVSRPSSLLRCLFVGNYQNFEQQRQRLEQASQRLGLRS